MNLNVTYLLSAWLENILNRQEGAIVHYKTPCAAILSKPSFQIRQVAWFTMLILQQFERRLHSSLTKLWSMSRQCQLLMFDYFKNTETKKKTYKLK